MGLGFQVSALHRVATLDIQGVESTAADEREDAFETLLTDQYGRPRQRKSGKLSFAAQSSAVVTAWRKALSLKYSSSLGEPLWWNEESTDLLAIEIGSLSHLSVLYAAAIVDNHGEGQLRHIAAASNLSVRDAHALIGVSFNRGLSGEFPQLLLGVTHWLPVSKDFLVDERDWLGRSVRIGSAISLQRELQKLNSSIEIVGSRPCEVKPAGNSPATLVVALNTLVQIYSLCHEAVARNLPLTRIE